MPGGGGLPCRVTPALGGGPRQAAAVLGGQSPTPHAGGASTTAATRPTQPPQRARRARRGPANPTSYVTSQSPSFFSKPFGHAITGGAACWLAALLACCTGAPRPQFAKQASACLHTTKQGEPMTGKQTAPQIANCHAVKRSTKSRKQLFCTLATGLATRKTNVQAGGTCHAQQPSKHKRHIIKGTNGNSGEWMGDVVHGIHTNARTHAHPGPWPGSVTPQAASPWPFRPAKAVAQPSFR